MSVTIGIDVSKLKFDVCILKSDGTKTHIEFDNKKQDLKNFINALKVRVINILHLKRQVFLWRESLCLFVHEKAECFSFKSRSNRPLLSMYDEKNEN